MPPIYRPLWVLCEAAAVVLPRFRPKSGIPFSPYPRCFAKACAPAADCDIVGRSQPAQRPLGQRFRDVSLYARQAERVQCCRGGRAPVRRLLRVVGRRRGWVVASSHKGGDRKPIQRSVRVKNRLTLAWRRRLRVVAVLRPLPISSSPCRYSSSRYGTFFAPGNQRG